MRNTLAALLLASATFAVGCAADTADTGETSGDATLAAKFDVWQSQSGQWFFHLKAGNGQVLLTSEAYTTRVGALNGLLATETDGVDPRFYNVVAAAHGYDVDLTSGNHEIIASSEVYSTKANATRAVTTFTNAVVSYLDQREAVTSGARVQLGNSSDGHTYFNYVAQNGQIVLTSQMYSSEAAALDGAFAVQGAQPASYKVQANKAGGYYFTVSAPNGQIVGTSQQYTTKESAQAGVTAVEKLAASVSIL